MLAGLIIGDYQRPIINGIPIFQPLFQIRKRGISHGSHEFQTLDEQLTLPCESPFYDSNSKESDTYFCTAASGGRFKHFKLQWQQASVPEWLLASRTDSHGKPCQAQDPICWW